MAIGDIKKREDKKRRVKAEAMLKEKNRIPEADKALARTFLAALPREITVDEVKVIAKAFNRSPEGLRLAIESARSAFLVRAESYIEAHFHSVKALQNGGDYDAAAKHIEWAIENMGTKEGMLLEKPDFTAKPNGPQVLIGVNMGGVRRDNEG